MTCWPDERAAIFNMIEHFGTGCFATVMDSYDYGAALEQVRGHSMSAAFEELLLL
jgi:hypothetical protein